MPQLSEQDINRLVTKVMDRLGTPSHKETPSASVAPPVKNSTVSDAISRTIPAQKEWVRLKLSHKERVIRHIRMACEKNVEILAKAAVEETGLGRVEDKINKNRLVIHKTPGTEHLTPQAYTGDDGLTLIERTAYGVIGSITPCTNPTETIICNTIGMIAGGNGVVFNVHPVAKNVCMMAVEIIQNAIANCNAPKDIVSIITDPTIESATELLNHPEISLNVVTGGPGVVKAALRVPKKAICAGPGNPPVVVDESADLDKAGRAIVLGASLDNNIVCSDEKEIIATDAIAEQLKMFLRKHGAYVIKKHHCSRLEKVILDNGHPNKIWVGKNANRILEEMGIRPDKDYRLIVAETDFDHPFVQRELLMPVIPIVRVKDIHQAIEKAYIAEHGNKHTAVIHSKNIDNMDAMARAMNTSIFVKNAPAYAGLGLGGEGYTSFTIAGTTGEGMTTVKDFTRERRCALAGYFRIV